MFYINHIRIYIRRYTHRYQSKDQNTLVKCLLLLIEYYILLHLLQIAYRLILLILWILFDYA